MATVGELEILIYEVEGFCVKFYKNGKKVRSDCGVIKDYSYKKAGYDTWTVKKWKGTRMVKYLQDFDIEVLENNGNAAASHKTLKKLRKSYPVVKKSAPQISSTQVPCILPNVSEANTVKLQRLEKVIYPVLKRDNPSSIPSIEIAIDYVPEEYRGESLELMLNLVQQWVDDNSYTGKGVVWQWFCMQSVDFMELWGPVPAEFMCLIGFPKECRETVAAQLKNKLEKAVKYPADPLGYHEIQDARSMAYAETGIVWQPLDACTWISVNER